MRIELRVAVTACAARFRFDARLRLWGGDFESAQFVSRWRRQRAGRGAIAVDGHCGKQTRTGTGRGQAAFAGFSVYRYDVLVRCLGSGGVWSRIYRRRRNRMKRVRMRLVNFLEWDSSAGRCELRLGR
ncbi:unnamed protein product [Ostreobium quekettii]|uniref:Uncharacterized protein n=1 Tax=Ostreobium quekettii TaxID=121088 RepID=A0A8S1IYY3_9CHLO|nr:unnamed protein product [Ostreobium quekettii]